MTPMTWLVYGILVLAGSVLGSWLGQRLYAWWMARRGEGASSDLLEAFRLALGPHLGQNDGSPEAEVMIRVTGDQEYGGHLVAMDSDTVTVLIEADGLKCRWVVRADEILAVATRTLTPERQEEYRKMKEIETQARRRLVESATRLNSLSDAIRVANEAKEKEEKDGKVN